MENNNISACLVVRSEGKIIRRCLESLSGAVDEIILVHDGEISDNTLEIAGQYTDKIFIRPYRGAMEFHLAFAFSKASGRWILRIDADEFLSAELKLRLKSLAQEEGVSAYRFLWPYWDGKKRLTKNWPHKLALFRKDKVSILGIPHYTPFVNGKVVNLNAVLCHEPEYDNFNWRSFREKWLKWAKIQAGCYLKNFAEIEKFGRTGNEWPLGVKFRISFPLIIMPFDFILTFFRGIFGTGFISRLENVKIILMQSAYKAMVDYYLFKIK